MAGEGAGSPNFVPSPKPASLDYQFADAPLLSSSALSGGTQAQATYGGRWIIQMGWSSFDRADLAPIAARLNRYGRGVTFTTYLVDRERPIAASSMTPAQIITLDAQLDTLKVAASSQVGYEIDLVTTGIGDYPGLLSAGDLIGFVDPGGNYQMFELREDLDIEDNAGTAYLSQPIRQAPLINAQIFSRYVPVQVIMLETVRVSVTPPVIYQLTVRVRENITLASALTL